MDESVINGDIAPQKLGQITPNGNQTHILTFIFTRFAFGVCVCDIYVTIVTLFSSKMRLCVSYRITVRVVIKCIFGVRSLICILVRFKFVRFYLCVSTPLSLFS